jgi:hypothetical protein
MIKKFGRQSFHHHKLPHHSGLYFNNFCFAGNRGLKKKNGEREREVFKVKKKTILSFQTIHRKIFSLKTR